MRFLALALAATLLLTGCAGAAVPAASPQSSLPSQAPEETETTPPETTQPQPEHFLLTFVGDCAFGGQPQLVNAGYGFPQVVGDDFSYPFRNVAQWFENDDFSMVNLECVLGDAGRPVPKAHNLRGPGKYVQILTENSVEAVTLANNHTLDYGQAGYDETLTILDNAGVPYVEKAGTLLFTTESGLTIGIYAEEYQDMDMDRLTRAVAQLRCDGAEIIIYAVHWGSENNFRPRPDQIEWAHQAIEAGVDILYGTHPHVLQYVENYQGGLILYSLGNFSFGGNMYPKDLDTALVQVEVIRQPDGSIALGQQTLVPLSCSSIPVRNNYQPTPYDPESQEYLRTMDKLTGSYTGGNLPIG